MSTDKKNIPETSFKNIKNRGIFEEFLKKNKLEDCTNCGSSEYGITLDAGIPTFTNTQLDKSFLPIVVKICNKCANTILLSSFVMKLKESEKI